MALAGKKGCTLAAVLNTVQAFGEDQGRYVLTSARDVVVPNAVAIGIVGGTKVAEVELADLRAAHDSFFKEWMEQ
jgi:phosphoribosylformylglycinamidine synthase